MNSHLPRVPRQISHHNPRSRDSCDHEIAIMSIAIMSIAIMSGWPSVGSELITFHYDSANCFQLFTSRGLVDFAQSLSSQIRNKVR